MKCFESEANLAEREASRAPAASVGLASIALLTYVLTQYPDVAGGDSGELVGAVATGGVIHPPGYPLYAILARLFVRIPHGTLAWRMGFMSAVCDALAAGVLCFAVARRTRSSAAGVVTGAAFAFAPGIWAYAICAEVFALNNLVVAVLVLLAVLYDTRHERRYALWGALVVGLGMSNHQSMVFTALPLSLWMLWVGRDDLLRRPVRAQLVGLVCLGLLPYASLFNRGSLRSAVSWGEIDSWGTFWWHVLRRDYGTLRLIAPSASSGAAPGATIVAFIQDLLRQVGYFGVLPVGVGLSLIAARRGAWKVGLGACFCVPPALAVMVFALLGNMLMTQLVYRTIMARFWQQPDIYVFMSVGFAVAHIERMVGDRNGRIAAGRVAAAAAMAASLLAIVSRVQAMNRHGNTLVQRYGAEILRAVPPNALLLTRGDLVTNVVRYLQAAEHMRPDVRVVDLEILGFPWAAAQVDRLYPEVVLPGRRYMPGAVDGFDIRSLLDANIERAPIVVCGGFKAGDTSADTKYRRSAVGFCEAIHLVTDSVDESPDEWLRESESALPRIDVKAQDHPPGSWERVVYDNFIEAIRNRAMYAVKLADRAPSLRWLDVWAVDALQRLVGEYPDVPPHVYEDLAIALARLGLQTSEQRTRVVDALRTFLNLGLVDGKHRLLVEGEIQRLSAIGSR